MTKDQNSIDKSPNTISYNIRVRGHLGPQWSEWFGDIDLRLENDGNTLLSGPYVDQAAVHALLRKIRDAGMILHSVTCVTDE